MSRSTRTLIPMKASITPRWHPRDRIVSTLTERDERQEHRDDKYLIDHNERLHERQRQLKGD